MSKGENKCSHTTRVHKIVHAFPQNAIIFRQSLFVSKKKIVRARTWSLEVEGRVLCYYFKYESNQHFRRKFIVLSVFSIWEICSNILLKNSSNKVSPEQKTLKNHFVLIKLEKEKKHTQL